MKTCLPFEEGTLCFSSSLKHLADAKYSFDQRIDIFACIIKGKTGSASAFYAQAMHERFSTMMACANCYAESVEQSSHIEMMNVAYLERNNGSMLLDIWPVNLHAFHFHESLQGLICEVALVGFDGVETNRSNIIESFCEAS